MIVGKWSHSMYLVNTNVWSDYEFAFLSTADNTHSVTWFNMTKWNNTKNILSCSLGGRSFIQVSRNRLRLTCYCDREVTYKLHRIYLIELNQTTTKYFGNTHIPYLKVDFSTNQFEIFDKRLYYFTFEPHPSHPLGVLHDGDRLYVIYKADKNHRPVFITELNK